MDYETYDEATELANYRSDIKRDGEVSNWERQELARQFYIASYGTDLGFDPYWDY